MEIERKEVREGIIEIGVHNPMLTESEFVGLLTPEERAHQLPLAGFNQPAIGHYPNHEGLYALVRRLPGSSL